MSDKIKHSDLKNIAVLENQGGSKTTLYSATLNGDNVVVKVSDSDDARFLQEQKVLELSLPGVVRYYGWGDDFDGKRFLVMEKLNSITGLHNTHEIANAVMIATRMLFINNHYWCASPKHVMVNDSGEYKIIDFNDDSAPRRKFFGLIEGYDFIGLLKKLCPSIEALNATHGPEEAEDVYYEMVSLVISRAVDSLVKFEYQQLKDVHQPIWHKRYFRILSRETDKDDPRFGELVEHNRKCFDRAEMFNPLLADGNIKTLLDIGCNVGWFTFNFASKGVDCLGVDFDNGKIMFNKMMSELSADQISGYLNFKCDTVNMDFIDKMESYDMILALSVLHNLLLFQDVSREEWIKLFKALSGKVTRVMIFEVGATILGPLGFRDWNTFFEWLRVLGNYDELEILGTSDINRPVVALKRKNI